MNIEELAAAYEAATREFLQIATSVPAEKLDVNDGEVLVAAVVVENVCPAALIPFKVYKPLLLHTALPDPSVVNTALVVV